MYRIKLSILNYSEIIIYTDLKHIVEILKNNLNKLSKTIPVTNIEIEEIFVQTEFPIINKNQLFLLNNEKKYIKFYKEDNITYMFSPESEMRFPDLVYVLLHMFCNDLLNKRKYLTHSSALKYDTNKSIVLIGDANAGKSSLAFKLMDDYGYKLIANDHVLLGIDDGKLSTFTGTKELEMRLGVINQNFPKLMSKINVNKNDDLWQKKIIINNYIDSSMLSKNDNTIVTDIFQINVIEGGSAFIKTKEHVDQLLYLYEQISKQIKGTYNLITGFGYPLPSLENSQYLNELYNDVKVALNETEVHMAKGTLNDLSKQMVKKLEKK